MLRFFFMLLAVHAHIFFSCCLWLCSQQTSQTGCGREHVHFFKIGFQVNGDACRMAACLCPHSANTAFVSWNWRMATLQHSSHRPDLKQHITISLWAIFHSSALVLSVQLQPSKLKSSGCQKSVFVPSKLSELLPVDLDKPLKRAKHIDWQHWWFEVQVGKNAWMDVSS